MIEALYALSYVEDVCKVNNINLNPNAAQTLSQSTCLVLRIASASMAIFGKNNVRFTGITALIAVEIYENWRDKNIEPNTQ